MIWKNLKGKKEDPFWKEILRGSYESLGEQIESVKCDIEKNRFEMKQMVTSHLGEYIKSEETAIKLTEEVSKIRIEGKSKELKNMINKFKKTQIIEEENKSNKEKPSNLELPTQSSFEKFRRCIQESDYMEIFEVERVIQQCLKAEEYEELGQLLYWLEKLILKNKEKSCLQNAFSEVMQKYRRVLCNTLFQGYQRNKKEKLKKFFVDFGKNLRSSKDAYLFEIFSAHFSRIFRQTFEKRKTQLIQTHHVANILDSYGISLNKSMRFVHQINEHLKEPKQGQILQFVNKFRRSLVDLAEKLKPTKLNEIKTRISLFQEPLKTQLSLGSVQQFQISCHKNLFFQKTKVFLRYQENAINIFNFSLQNDETNNQSQFESLVSSSESLRVILSVILTFKYLLELNKLNKEQTGQCLQKLISQIEEEASKVEQLFSPSISNSDQRKQFFKMLQVHIKA